MTPLQFYTQILAYTAKAERWCIASVVHTRGSTPRKKNAQMAVALDANGALIAPIASIGGGAGEAKVLQAASALLNTVQLNHETIEINLSGQAGANSSAISGVCGGHMRLRISTFTSAQLHQRAQFICDALKAGQPLTLDPVTMQSTAQDAHESICLIPAPMCLIAGGGHCGVALAELLVRLGFPIVVIDERDEVFGCAIAPELDVQQFNDWASALAVAKNYQIHGATNAMAVLLSRSYSHDLTALHAIAQSEVAFSIIGMMGSTRRIRVVRQQLGDYPAALLAALKAPIGLQIGAETPNEIAVSIAAELLSLRSATNHKSPIFPKKTEG